VETVPPVRFGLDIPGRRRLPRGRVVEVFGPEGFRQDHASPAGHRRSARGGGTAAFVDAEHALDPSLRREAGVNINDLLVSQPDTGEQALEITDIAGALERGRHRVIDSVAASHTQAE